MTNFRVDNADLLTSGSSAQVSVVPSECPFFFNKFSCERNIPECELAEGGQVGQAVTGRCYASCNAVSECLDAFLMKCIEFVNTPEGLGDCEGFDWGTAASGATCNPGFFCQGLEDESTLLAREVRNCDQPTEFCQDRPYMLDGGFCQFGTELPNLCSEFQKEPDNAINDGLKETEQMPLWAVGLLVGAVLAISFGGFFFQRMARKKNQEQMQINQMAAVPPVVLEPPPPFDPNLGKPVFAGAGESVADQLAKLSDLRAQGALSEEEFLVAKDKVLSAQA